MARILVVDDDKLIRWSLSAAFGEEGHAVDTASSVSEAVSLARSRSYRLIVADLEIRDESGPEMLKEIRRIRPGIPVIVISALSRQRIADKLEELAVEGFFSKPFETKELKAAAGKVLQTAKEDDKPDEGPASRIEYRSKTNKEV